MYVWNVGLTNEPKECANIVGIVALYVRYGGAGEIDVPAERLHIWCCLADVRLGRLKLGWLASLLGRSQLTRLYEIVTPGRDLDCKSVKPEVVDGEAFTIAEIARRGIWPRMIMKEIAGNMR